MTLPAISLLEKQAPSAPLNAFVEEYRYRKISLHDSHTIIKEMPCRAANSLDFFIGGSYKTFLCSSGQLIPFARCTIRGPRTYRKYRIEINEDFACFSIRFKPTGIYQLLGIPMSEFCDQSVDASLVMPALFNDITEQLMECKDFDSCKNMIEPFLINQLSLRSADSASEKLATLIKDVASASRITSLYKDIPLSGRHLERNFRKEVGVSPKTYSNLLRFEKVMQARKQRPSEKWSVIAYEFNYFDQMHLVKDFKKFLNITPTAFRPGDFAF
ncbi:helix-turn-helix domain-containing protein [Ohtaekwangia koreensis]|uniref:Helix-turn-helix domain-containing protein n=1 Tax=Ohtaekwangia koreensis TaxID=688867 RepID=A0A1T5M2A5_9BACT|nr:helix-turn-helix domain-containing protein [Ohtaekwangia koreensis]SKC82326.1 Helix-turn-helix domain-containing protein [Ohtaekwangia koreensis]